MGAPRIGGTLRIADFRITSSLDDMSPFRIGTRMSLLMRKTPMFLSFMATIVVSDNNPSLTIERITRRVEVSIGYFIA
jgi:hypothetical protein